MTAPVLLSTVGSLGDLFPVLSLAHALQAKGQPVRLALSPEDTQRAKAQGLDAFPYGPTEAETLAFLGMDKDAVAQQVFRNPSPILRRAVYPQLADLVRGLIPEARRSRAVGGTLLALAAPLAAEMVRRPYIELVLQPMLLRSALDPPRVSGFVPPMHPAPNNTLTHVWNNAWLRVIDTEFRRRHGRAQSRVRADLGLPPTRAVPLFGNAIPPRRRIGLWDAAFSAVPSDRSDGLLLTGFPRPAPSELSADLERFLNAGPPPLVVTLGSVSHRLAGERFWHEAAALARRNGLRAVLLSGDADAPEGPDIHRIHAAPHDALFTRAAAVLHHGGVGTTGAACIAGVSQLILPLGADQPDNAARIERIGVGRRIRSVAKADDALAFALSPDTREAARSLAERMIPDAADRAADAFLAAL
ncbi:hypothetical protein PARPLA_01961 [Rhodobacteraceae bacterium THAF1]|uniref:nucleotide disphospho-sugar-binding domain-containing protein n=1 Tax=Palleronia sp. THAF1 TaxID=2587842 RepID=UPI000F3CBADF|nr:nucleotide disphospho-sugar-binding domain-containing protein [Palleronia sp. THAF1]QFU08904.1 hypothetical protein FIU81_09490 [Palleronia sp. THAF1]VDC24384.1 hypothetical protein PARPLA_01961 [Rhodobacteraceae bacterium THAF1]